MDSQKTKTHQEAEACFDTQFDLDFPEDHNGEQRQDEIRYDGDDSLRDDDPLELGVGKTFRGSHLVPGTSDRVTLEYPQQGENDIRDDQEGYRSLERSYNKLLDRDP